MLFILIKENLMADLLWTYRYMNKFKTKIAIPFSIFLHAFHSSTGDKWQTRRKMLTPSFHFRILNDFLQVFNEQAKIMADRLESRVGKGTFDMTQHITLCALDIICGIVNVHCIYSPYICTVYYVHCICELYYLDNFMPCIYALSTAPRIYLIVNIIILVLCSMKSLAKLAKLADCSLLLAWREIG